MRSPRVLLCLAWLLGPGLACADSEAPSAESATSMAPDHATRERLEALEAAPTVEDLLALLRRPHREQRALIGPHHLRQTTTIELRPVEPLGRPARPGEIVETDLAVSDELDLRWATTEAGDLRFSLRQHNDQDAARELVVIGEEAYTRMHEPTWYHRPLDGELHELWLDDAIRGPGDLLAFAAPQLAWDGPERTQIEGRPVLRFALRLGPKRRVKPDEHPSGRWRATAELIQLEGELLIDAQTGACLGADIELGWRMRDRARRLLAGHATLTASVTPGAQAVSPPADAQPMPERHRYEVERKKLLDGLAAL